MDLNENQEKCAAYRRRAEELVAQMTLEEKVEQIGALVTSVEKLALNMEIMANELKQQGERLESLEARDGENWRKAVGHIVTVVIGAVIGFICTRIGL